MKKTLAALLLFLMMSLALTATVFANTDNVMFGGIPKAETGEEREEAPEEQAGTTPAENSESVAEETPEAAPAVSQQEAPETTPANVPEEQMEQNEPSIVGEGAVIAVNPDIMKGENGNYYLNAEKDDAGNPISGAGTPMVNGKKYWVTGADRCVGKGWMNLGDWSLYFDPETFAARTGLCEVASQQGGAGTKRYIFDDNGVKQNFAGTPVINGKKYWVNQDDSSLRTGWMNLGDWSLYFDPDTCEARTGLCQVPDQKGSDQEKRYIFDRNGVKQNYAGTPVIDGKKYWVNQDDSSLRTGWMYLGAWRMYFDESTCAARTGLTVIEEKNYLFDNNGVLQAAAGTPVINGYKYCFNQDGSLRSGWVNIGSWKLYFYPGTFRGAVGVSTVEGTAYIFDKNGIFCTGKGIQTVNGTIYCFNENGSARTGWVTQDSKTYYFDPSTGAAARGTTTIDGKKYYFDNNGVQGVGRKIAIDPGHQAHWDNGREPVGPGARETKTKMAAGTYGRASGLNEYELNLTVSLKLRDELVKRGYEIYMIRETHDVDFSNATRAQMAAESGSQILVRIHANGDANTSVRGALNIAPKSDNPYLSRELISASQSLSQIMIDHFCAATGARNRGVEYYNNMTGINWSTIPVTIVEMGFMSNASEDRSMATGSYQDKMVQGMANGIDAYFNGL